MSAYKRESHFRSFLKSVSWRIFATTDTILVALLITCFFGNCSLESAVMIGAAEFLIKFLVYYIHERIWQKHQEGKDISKRFTLKKSISWRLIATVMTFIISGTILDSFNQIALFIALTELITKFVLYYLHERLWLNLPLGRVRNFVYKKILRKN